MIPTRPEPPALPGVIPPPPPWYRSAAAWLVRHIGRLRFELAPVGGAAAYATAVDIYAATDNSAEPAVAFGVAAGACAALAGFLIAKEEPETVAAYRLGSASAACTWGCWQLASDSALVPGLILGSIATAVISIPYWRSLGARHERDVDRAEHRLDRETDERIAQTRAMEAAFKARAKLIPGQGPAPAIESIPGRPELPTVEWPGARTGLTIADPIPLSDRTSIVLPGGHVLIGGGTDAGKSNLVHVVACTVITRGNAKLLGIDMKPGAVELGVYRKAGARIASSKQDAMALLHWVRDEGVRRGEQMGATIHDDGTLTRAWTPTGDAPHLVLFIDELAELVDADPKAAQLLKSHTRLLRAMGITVVAATQSPSRHVFGGDSDSRGQYGTRICVATFEPTQTNIILGQGAHGAGWRADQLDGRGSFLIQSRAHRDPDPDRSYLMTDPGLAGHVNAHAVGGPVRHRDAEPEAFTAPAPGRIENATELITDYLREHGPSTVEEVHHGLGLPPEKLISVRTLMRRHGNTGRFVTVNGGRYKLPKTDGTVVRFRSRRNA